MDSQILDTPVSWFAMEENTVKSIANALSTLTIMSCLFLKVPQILNIQQKRSAEGIYPQAILMEISGFTIITLYNYNNDYSLMTYMEYPIILIQMYVMFYYVLKYKKMLSLPRVPLGIIIYIGGIILLMMQILPNSLVSYLVPFCTPLNGFAKVTYIYGMVRAGNADAVSLTTWVISVLTNLARVFTIYVDSADIKLMLNFIISTVLSSGVLGTAIFHQMQSKRAPQRLRRKSAVRRHSHIN